MYTHLKRAAQWRKTVTSSFMAILLVLVVGLFSSGFVPLTGQAGPAAAGRGKIEPEAGQWQTWVLESGEQIRLPKPPTLRESRKEMDILRQYARDLDAEDLAQIEYWNTGAPAYRWNQIALNETLNRNMGAPVAFRALALVNAGIYDATVAAWDNKYEYNRLRPAELVPTFKTVVTTPKSPAYPSEHAVTAGAASEIMAYLFPDKADEYRAMALEAGRSTLLAGTQFPSDVERGLQLGRQVAALVIERGMADGSDVPWDGQRPEGPGYWNGQNPALPMFGTVKPFVLTSGSEFRPAPPLAYDSPEKAAELDVLRAYERTPKSNAHAFFWEYGAGGTRIHEFWMNHAARLTLEKNLSGNAPRAARVFALTSIALFDSSVATWDGKYAYWAIRPFQLDPAFTPIFATPGHPSYPAAHATLSTTAAEILAYLFPSDAAQLRAHAAAAGDSRIWAGIHYPSDIEAGETLGTDVANKVIERASQDGSDR